jgi:hypothetical protein
MSKKRTISTRPMDALVGFRFVARDLDGMLVFDRAVSRVSTGFYFRGGDVTPQFADTKMIEMVVDTMCREKGFRRLSYTIENRTVLVKVDYLKRAK